MRRKDQEISDPVLLESIIAKAEICRLGLSLNDVPYVVPVNFGYRDNCIYIHSSPEGRKMETINHNDKVCFEMECDVEVVRADAPCDWTTRYFSVVGFGRAHLVTDYEEKVKGLNAIMEHYSDVASFQFPEPKVNRAAVIRIEIESMTGKRASYPGNPDAASSPTGEQPSRVKIREALEDPNTRYDAVLRRLAE